MPDAHADHCITDPPFSAYVHTRSMRSNDSRAQKKGRSRSMSGGKPTRRDLGFAHLTPELMRDVACEIARVTKRWVLVFTDVESTAAWRFALQGGGLDYVRTGVWVKSNAAPQFSGDRPAQAFEAFVIAHAKGAKRWNGGGRDRPVRGERRHGDRVSAGRTPLRGGGARRWDGGGRRRATGGGAGELDADRTACRPATPRRRGAVMTWWAWVLVAAENWRRERARRPYVRALRERLRRVGAR